MLKRSIILLSVILAISLASAAPAAKALKFEYDLTPGAITKHRLTADVEITNPPRSGAKQGPPMKVQLSALIRTKVLEKLPDGTAKVSVSTEQMKMQMQGSDSAMDLPTQTVVAIVDKHGKLVKYVEGKRSSFDIGSSTGEVGAFMKFPPKQIKVGESWTNKISLGKDSEIEVKSKLASNSVLLGKNRASKITHSFNGAFETSGGSSVPGQAGVSGKGKVSGSGTTHFSSAKKKVLRTEADIEMTLQPASGGSPGKTKLSAMLEAI